MITISQNELKALKEKAVTIKVMLENFDPNSQEEINFIKSIASNLSDDFSKITEIKE